MLYVNEFVNDELWDRDVPADWVRSFGTDHFPVVTAANGEIVSIASSPASPGSFERYLEAIEQPDLAIDQRFADTAERIRNVTELVQIVRDWGATMPDAASIEQTCDVVGLATGQLRTVSELAGTAWAADRQAVVEVPDRAGGVLRMPNAPWRFRHTRTDVVGEARYRGEDNRQVLEELLGLTGDDVAAMEASGVLSSRVPAGRPQ